MLQTIDSIWNNEEVMIMHISCDCNLCFPPLSPIQILVFLALSWFLSYKTLHSWTHIPATVQPNNLSHRSQKIKPKLFLGWGKDKRRCVLTVVWRFDVRLLQLLLCGWCLRFSSSSPVENTLLRRVWRSFDLSWCHFCWSWRNVSVKCIWQNFKQFDQMSVLLTTLNEFVLLFLLVFHFFPVIPSHGSHHLPLFDQRSLRASESLQGFGGFLLCMKKQCNLFIMAKMCTSDSKLIILPS